MNLDDIISLQDAAASLGVSPDTLRTQMERGRFTGKLVGRQVITTLDEVERYRRESLGMAGGPMVGELARLPWPHHERGYLRIIGNTDTPEPVVELVRALAAAEIESGARYARDVTAEILQEAIDLGYLLTSGEVPPYIGISRADVVSVETGRRTYVRRTRPEQV